MKNEILYVGQFRLPDGDAAAIRVGAIGDALVEAGFRVRFVGHDASHLEGAAGTGQLLHRLAHMTKRGIDTLMTSASYVVRLEGLDWTQVVAVICYPGSSSLICRLLRLCSKQGIPLIIDSTEWYEPSHTLGGKYGPFAIDSELRMRWIYPRVKNLICISSFLSRHYASRGCNVITIPPLVGHNTCYAGSLSTPGIANSGTGVSLVYAGNPGKKELFAEIITGLQSARSQGIDASIEIVGVSNEQLMLLLGRNRLPATQCDGVVCYGRLPRAKALEIVSASDFTVILRPQARFANAGFPSKFVESLAFGVPVIANATSDIADYLRDGIDGYLLEEPSADAIERAIVRASKLSQSQRLEMRKNAQQRALECFNYRNYAELLGRFIVSAKPC